VAKREPAEVFLLAIVVRSSSQLHHVRGITDKGYRRLEPC